MTKLDPTIVVIDLAESSKWYQSVFGGQSVHGGNKFDIMVDKNDAILPNHY
jgi:hypothetical protein